MREGRPMTRRTGYLAYTAAALALLALYPAAAQAYSLKTTPRGYHVRWWKQPIRLKMGDELERSMKSGQARQAAVMAAEAWRGLPDVPDILIEEGRASGFDPERRTNGIYLVRQWNYDPRSLAVTVSSYTPDGKLLGTDILINGNVRFDMLSETEGNCVQKDPPFDLASVLTHEMGHVLGLDENHDDPEATMWPYTHAGETHQRTLSEDDEEGVIELYSAYRPEAALGCGSASVAGSPVNCSNTPVFLAILFSLAVTARLRFRQA